MKNNNFFINKLKQAEESNIYRPKSGAKFGESFKWLSRDISDTLGIRLNVYSTTILSKNFKILLDKGYFFTIGTKKANREYFEEIKDGDIGNLDYNSGDKRGHLQTYCKDINTGKYYIVENYKGFLSDNTIEFDFDKLIKATKTGMYYKTARTIVPQFNKKNITIFNSLQKNKSIKKIDIAFFQDMIKNKKYINGK